MFLQLLISGQSSKACRGLGSLSTWMVDKQPLLFTSHLHGKGDAPHDKALHCIELAQIFGTTGRSLVGPWMMTRGWPPLPAPAAGTSARGSLYCRRASRPSLAARLTRPPQQVLWRGVAQAPWALLPAWHPHRG